MRMRAVVVEKLGGPEVLSVIECPEPEPQAGQVLVQVAAAGVNFMDIYTRQGVGGYKRPSFRWSWGRRARARSPRSAPASPGCRWATGWPGRARRDATPPTRSSPPAGSCPCLKRSTCRSRRR